MKLGEYISTVAHVLTRHKADAEIGDALAEGHGMAEGGVSGHFNKVLGEVRDALSGNKKLLGVFDDGPQHTNGNARGVDGAKPVKEREINPEDLKRHILAVRNSLSGYGEKKKNHVDIICQYDSPEAIIERILNDLTLALGVYGLGKVFGPEERNEYGAQFGRETGDLPPQSDAQKQGDGAPRLKWRDNMPPAGTPAYNTFKSEVMAQLRREGKIK